MEQQALTAEQIQQANALYKELAAVINKHRLQPIVVYCVLGMALCKTISHHDAEIRHALVDEFAKSTHDLINRGLG